MQPTMPQDKPASGAATGPLARQVTPEEEEGRALGMLQHLGVDGPDAEGDINLAQLTDALMRQDGSVHPGTVAEVRPHSLPGPLAVQSLQVPHRDLGCPPAVSRHHAHNATHRVAGGGGVRRPESVVVPV